MKRRVHPTGYRQKPQRLPAWAIVRIKGTPTALIGHVWRLLVARGGLWSCCTS